MRTAALASTARRSRRRAAAACVGQVVLLLAIASCAGESLDDYTAAEARALLERRGISWSEEEFLRRARAREHDVVAAFLAAGFDPDAQNGRALAMAAAEGRRELLRLLLAAGADPNSQGGSFGQTALVSAVIRDHPALVSLLLEAGAKPDAPSRGGASALLFAKDAATARLLLDAGARVDVRDKTGATPLMGAVVLGELELVDLLLERGADPNAVDAQGRTPLLLAVVFRFAAIEGRLHEGGAVPQPPPSIPHATLEAYPGRYGAPGEVVYQVLFDRGRLLLIQASSKGTLSEYELIALTETTFYRAGDPGVVPFRFDVVDGRVAGLARLVGGEWVSSRRLD